MCVQHLKPFPESCNMQSKKNPAYFIMEVKPLIDHIHNRTRQTKTEKPKYCCED